MKEEVTEILSRLYGGVWLTPDSFVLSLDTSEEPWWVESSFVFAKRDVRVFGSAEGFFARLSVQGHTVGTARLTLSCPYTRPRIDWHDVPSRQLDRALDVFVPLLFELLRSHNLEMLSKIFPSRLRSESAAKERYERLADIGARRNRDAFDNFLGQGRAGEELLWDRPRWPDAELLAEIAAQEKRTAARRKIEAKERNERIAVVFETFTNHEVAERRLNAEAPPMVSEDFEGELCGICFAVEEECCFTVCRMCEELIEDVQGCRTGFCGRHEPGSIFDERKGD